MRAVIDLFTDHVTTHKRFENGGSRLRVTQAVTQAQNDAHTVSSSYTAILSNVRTAASLVNICHFPSESGDLGNRKVTMKLSPQASQLSQKLSVYET
jgi:hypothetical protein